MVQLKSPIEILRLLDQSNCGKCGKPTCLAFAAATFKGNCQLDECPNLSSDVVERHSVKEAGQHFVEDWMEETLAQLKSRIAAMDLASAAERLGAEYSFGRLTVRCLGKRVGVDADGNLVTDIHTHTGLAIPLLMYILDSVGTPVSGEWINFRELEGGKDWYGLYQQTCERPLKSLADADSELFIDMLHVFGGRTPDHDYPADISIVLHPLPRVPIMISYSGPEDELESTLTILYDSTVEKHLSIELIHALTTDLARMFEKIALRHGKLRAPTAQRLSRS